MAEIVKFHSESDFKAKVRFLVNCEDGSVKELAAPNVQWRLIFATGNIDTSQHQYICSFEPPETVGEEQTELLATEPQNEPQNASEPPVYTNAYVDDDNRLVCVFDNHGMGKGGVYAKLLAHVPKDEYEDGIKTLVNVQSTGIELANYHTEDFCDPEISLILPSAFLDISDEILETDETNVKDTSPYAVMAAYADGLKMIKAAVNAKLFPVTEEDTFATIAEKIQQMDIDS